MGKTDIVMLPEYEMLWGSIGILRPMALYAIQHGRDQLDHLWPDFYTKEQNAELPAEEFFTSE